MTASELVFLPLGGCEEIGMNLNAYGYGPPNARRWILADVGVTFGSAATPGIDLICADPSYLDGEDVDGIILTHAHEDHIGAVGLLWPRFRAPVYATPFTAELARAKLLERGVEEKHLKTVPIAANIEIGPFTVEFVPLTHSIPEMQALAIRTPLGLVLHTGDWKIDPKPQVGEDIATETLIGLGDEGVLAMVCDSTNVFEEGEAGSEGSVREALKNLVSSLDGKVIVTTFASNVARVESIVMAAEAAGRHVCLVGRSMHKVTSAAKVAGMLKGVRDFVDEEDAGFLPPDKVLYLCTGSQGEPRAALGRISRGEHRHVSVGEGDTVIFSSRTIPGNETEIYAMQNLLADKGVNIITPRMLDEPIHVSGHPCRDELRRMYSWIRPSIAVPVHGERRHTIEHGRFAKSLQVSQAISPKNGDMVRLAPGEPDIIDHVPAGRLHLDGHTLVPADGAGLRERKQLAWRGCVLVSIAIDEDGDAVDGPVCSARGFSAQDGSADDDLIDALDEAAEVAFERMKRRARLSDDDVEEMLGRAVRRTCEREAGRRPVVDVMVLRV
ncbi:MAG: ribonuclease J [Pseudomonadota bacterium]